MIRTSILMLTTIILLSSCSNKFGIIKRKYNHGFYFSATHKNHALKKEVLAKKTIPSSKTYAPETTEVGTVKSNETTHFLVRTLSEPKNFHPEKKSGPEKKALAQVSKTPGNWTPIKSPQSIKRISLPNLNKDFPGKKLDDNTFILIAILCFFPFVNLISIYVFEDHKTSINFWVTLALDFTIIGGIIFSLLVIFEKVDLR